MKQSELEARLTRALHGVSGETPGRNTAVLLAKAQVLRRRRRERISFPKFLIRQVRGMGWQLWSVQGLLLLLFDRMLTQLYGEALWDSPVTVARLLFCLSTLVAMMALPLLYRSRKYRMQEIESASYFSSARLLLGRLAAIGLGDLLLLGGMLLAAMAKTSLEAGNLTCCLVLPFLVLSAAYLYMLGHCSGQNFFTGSIALSAAMLLLAVGLPGRWLPQFRQGMTLGTALLCLGLLAFSAGQLRYLLRRSPFGELQVI